MNSSLDFRPIARGCTWRKWCGSDGLRPHTKQACWATNLMCSLFRIRRGSDKLSWLLSIPLPAARLLAAATPGLAGKDVLAGSAATRAP